MLYLLFRGLVLSESVLASYLTRTSYRECSPLVAPSGAGSIPVLQCQRTVVPSPGVIPARIGPLLPVWVPHGGGGVPRELSHLLRTPKAFSRGGSAPDGLRRCSRFLSQFPS